MKKKNKKPQTPLVQRAVKELKKLQKMTSEPAPDYKQLVARSQAFAHATTEKSIISEENLHETLKEIAGDIHAELARRWDIPGPDAAEVDAVLQATLNFHDSMRMRYRENRDLFTERNAKYLNWMGDNFRALEAHEVLGPHWAALLKKKGRSNLLSSESGREFPPVPAPPVLNTTFVAKIWDELAKSGKNMAIIAPKEVKEITVNLAIDLSSPNITIQTPDEEVIYSESGDCFYDRDYKAIEDTEKIHYYRSLVQSMLGLADQGKVTLSLW